MRAAWAMLLPVPVDTHGAKDGVVARRCADSVCVFERPEIKSLCERPYSASVA